MGKLTELLQCAVESEVKVGHDGTGTYSIQSFVPQSPPEMLSSCGLSPEEYVVDGQISVRSRTLHNGNVVYAYTFKALPKTRQVDVAWLASRALSANGASRQATDSNKWFVFQAGDLQLGKRSSGGSTEEILERYWESVAAAKDIASRGDYAGIQLAFPGDCMEGTQSQGGKNVWLTQETITQQTRLFRRLLMVTVEVFAPLTSKLYLDVVNGNHDMGERRWNTYPGDGWATECAIAVRDGLELNKAAFGHVEVRVPDEWHGSMTVPVGDTIVTVAHGHQWPRNKGMHWWAEQSLHLQAAKDSQVLQHGHIHSWELEAARDRIRVSSPTFDCGSDWWREKHGGESKRGAVCYSLEGGEVSEMSLV